jgi:hypothetical protein
MPFGKPWKEYLWNLLYSLDQHINTLFGGYPDETISSRLGKLKKRQGGKLYLHNWYGIALPLDTMLEWIDPGHSIDAIEEDEGEPVFNRKGLITGYTKH